MSSGRKGKGRQKTEMKKINNKSNLQVTFSKCHNGLFKKASEFCTLCGVDVALVIFSPSGKLFSFGHSNIDTVINRYISRVPLQNNSSMQFIEAHRNTTLSDLNAQSTQMNNTLDNEKKCGDELSLLRKATEANFWWACLVDGMNRAELELLKKALEELKKLVAQHVNEIAINSAPTQMIPFFVGNDSSSNIPLYHQPNPQHAQVFPPQVFQNPMLEPHLFGFNNMGGEGGGYGPPDFF